MFASKGQLGARALLRRLDGVHILRCPSRTWWRSRSIPILTDLTCGVVGGCGLVQSLRSSGDVANFVLWAAVLARLGASHRFGQNWDGLCKTARQRFGELDYLHFGRMLVCAADNCPTHSFLSSWTNCLFLLKIIQYDSVLLESYS